MAIPFYLLKNPLKGKTRYIARTMITDNVDRDQLVELMVMANTTLTGPDITGMLSLLEDVLLYQLSQGKSIDLGNILSLRPSVRGSFTHQDLRKNPEALSLGMNLRIQKPFLKKFQGAARAVKEKQKSRHPTISGLNMEVLEEVIKKNKQSYSIYALHRYRPVSLWGSYLKEPLYNWEGLLLRRTKPPEKEIVVGPEDLEVLHHTAGKMIFSLAPSFKIPSWLKNGTDLGMCLVYSHAQPVNNCQSNWIIMRWQEG